MGMKHYIIEKLTTVAGGASRTANLCGVLPLRSSCDYAQISKDRWQACFETSALGKN